MIFEFALFTEFGHKTIKIDLKSDNVVSAVDEFYERKLNKIFKIKSIKEVKQVFDLPTLKINKKKIVYIFK